MLLSFPLLPFSKLDCINFNFSCYGNVVAWITAVGSGVCKTLSIGIARGVLSSPNLVKCLPPLSLINCLPATMETMLTSDITLCNTK